LTLLIAAADSIPNWNVTASCRGASSAGYVGQTSERLKSCLQSEKKRKRAKSLPSIGRRIQPQTEQIVSNQ